MTDSEAAAWTRGHAVGERELRAAEKRWQIERAALIAQRNARADEAERALMEIARLRSQWYRDPMAWTAVALAAGWIVAMLMGVV